MSEKLKALKAGGWTTFWAQEAPRCPHCGEVISIGDNDWSHLYNEDGSHDVVCPHCEEDFRVTSRASWTFSTDEQEEE